MMTADQLARRKLRLGVFAPHWQLPMTMDPTRAIRQEIDFLVFLDQVGYDEAWIGEHHSGGMELIGSPELLMAAAFERTTRIRLGSGVISLPYHNPLMVADRVLQLDHQAQGRAMFGFGPGLLPADAKMLGIDSKVQRGRLAEGLDVILRLLDGEIVTQKSEWFTLHEAFLQYAPYSAPRPEIIVASAVTPSGGHIAGQHGLGMLCVAAATGSGFDVLDLNWSIANDTAAKNGKVMDRSALRLVSGFHIAPTRDQAISEVREGFHRWHKFQNDSMEGSPKQVGYDSIEEIIENGTGVIGTPEDAVTLLERLWAKSGGFGCILNQVHNWASYEDTKRSHQLMAEYVMPAFTGRCEPRFASHKWTVDHRDMLVAAVGAGAKKAIDEHFAREAPAAKAA